MRSPFARLLLIVLVVLPWLCAPAAAGAQSADPPPPPEAAPQALERGDEDRVFEPLQPDFNLVALPTTLRVPAGSWAFRVTHRFTRDLGQGSFSDLASSLFGLDGGARIGLEVRAGLRPGTQLGLHRTSDRTIQLFLQQNLLSERLDGPLGFDLVATLEGGDNLSEDHRSALGVVLSKGLGERAIVYAQPFVVLGSRPEPFVGPEPTQPQPAGDEHTVLLGLAGRLRASRSVYLVAEYVPRVAGHRPFADQMTFGLESRAGGHLFQLNVGNGWGTTLGQLARGAVEDQWFLGFSISRKFF